MSAEPLTSLNAMSRSATRRDGAGLGWLLAAMGVLILVFVVYFSPEFVRYAKMRRM